MRIALVTNQPAPYRTPVFDLVGSTPGVDLHVFYCSKRESNRTWEIPPTSAPHTYLPGKPVRIRGWDVHWNPTVVEALRAFRPQVVITAGFNPTHLLAFRYARANGIPHVAMTDGTLRSEERLTTVHRAIRRFVYARSRAFLAASDGGQALYSAYGVPSNLVFKSCLAVENPRFATSTDATREFDLIYSGRFAAEKNPEIALHVANRLSRLMGRRIRILMLGDGPLKNVLESAAAGISKDVEVVFHGHVSQEELPRQYARAKILICGSKWESWGLVVNEACAAGLFVIASAEVGAAHELLQDGINGHIGKPDSDSWARIAAGFLNASAETVEAARQFSRVRLANYSYERAAVGLVEACRTAVKKHVSVIQRRMTHYRVPLFEGLRKELEQSDVSLSVYYGPPTAIDISRKDSAALTWGAELPVRRIGRGALWWANLPLRALESDLLICPHEASFLNIHLLAWTRRVKRFAFWGHGRNFQGDGSAVGDIIKQIEAPKAQWWFAYSSATLEHLRNIGCEEKRVTVLNNSIRRDVATAPTPASAGQTAIFLGSLHKHRRIALLLEVADLVKAKLPAFSLIIVGAGPDSPAVERFAADRPWVRYMGARHATEKANLLAEAGLMLCPSLVGLNILDGFFAGLPLVTTTDGQHSPEFAYFSEGENGISAPPEPNAIASAVIRVLNDQNLRLRLARGARTSGEKYSLDAMVRNFAAGIALSLASS